MLDLPTCGPGKGERVARTFSVMCGVSPALSGEVTDSRWGGSTEGVGTGLFDWLSKAW